MRISDWSSDVCSSDLVGLDRKPVVHIVGRRNIERFLRRIPHAEVGVGIVALDAARAPVVRDVERDRSLLVNAGDIIGMLRQLIGGNPAVDADNTELAVDRSEEHTSELQSLMLISYAVFCLKKTNNIFIYLH